MGSGSTGGLAQIWHTFLLLLTIPLDPVYNFLGFPARVTTARGTKQ
jgi:1-aminocyclopropane-1-carboxylate deaminase/D-cysteine desulfhydrase-like pyridoxal-dependent ACC family enzyme